MNERPKLRFVPQKKDATQLWEYALRALGRRALTVAELRRRLEEKAMDRSDVEPAMAKLAEYGYLNDERFAETFAGARRVNQGLGKQRVLQDLRGRRVDAETATQAVAAVFEGTDEVELAEQYVLRKFRNKDMVAYLADPAHLSSAYRKLRYAGFGSSACVKVLKRYSQRAEEIEE